MIGSAIGGENAREKRALHHVPDEEAMVRLDERACLAPPPDQALQPPIGRMETVREVPALERETGARDRLFEVRSLEDPHMSARRGVIAARQAPADPFRPEARHADAELALGLQDARDFGDRGFVVRQMLKDFRADDRIEEAIRKRELEAIAGDEAETAFPRLASGRGRRQSRRASSGRRGGSGRGRKLRSWRGNRRCGCAGRRRSRDREHVRRP